MREQIDRVKNWKQFNEGIVNSVNLEKYLRELIETKSKIDALVDNDEDNQKLYDRWISLLEDIKDYYKMKLESEFNKNGKWGVLKLFNNNISNFLQKEEYEEYTGIIRFDLTEFTRNLIKNGK